MILMSCSKNVSEPTADLSTADNSSQQSKAAATCNYPKPKTITVGADCYGTNYPGSPLNTVISRQNAVKWVVGNDCGGLYNFVNGAVYYSIYRKTGTTTGTIGAFTGIIDVYTKQIVFATSVSSMYYAGMPNNTAHVLISHEFNLANYPTTIYRSTSGASSSFIYTTLGTIPTSYGTGGVGAIYHNFFTTGTNVGPSCGID